MELSTLVDVFCSCSDDARIEEDVAIFASTVEEDATVVESVVVSEFSRDIFSIEEDEDVLMVFKDVLCSSLIPHHLKNNETPARTPGQPARPGPLGITNLEIGILTSAQERHENPLRFLTRFWVGVFYMVPKKHRAPARAAGQPGSPGRLGHPFRTWRSEFQLQPKNDMRNL